MEIGQAGWVAVIVVGVVIAVVIIWRLKKKNPPSAGTG